VSRPRGARRGSFRSCDRRHVLTFETTRQDRPQPTAHGSTPRHKPLCSAADGSCDDVRDGRLVSGVAGPRRERPTIRKGRCRDRRRRVLSIRRLRTVSARGAGVVQYAQYAGSHAGAPGAPRQQACHGPRSGRGPSLEQHREAQAPKIFSAPAERPSKRFFPGSVPNSLVAGSWSPYMAFDGSLNCIGTSVQ